MKIPYCLWRYLPYFDYLCPKCKGEVKKNSHECPHCGEKYPLAIRVPPYILKEFLKGNAKPMEEYMHKRVFPRVSAFERAYLTKYFTELFNNGFEEGNFSAWTGTSGSPSVQDVIKHYGSYAMFSNSGYCYKNIADALTSYFRTYIYFGAVPANSDIMTVYLGAGAEYLGGIIVKSDRWTLMSNRGGTTQDWMSAPQTNTWYCVELKTLGGVAGNNKMYIGGVERASINCDFTDKTVGRVSQGYAANAYFDCVVVADAYIGPEAAAGQQLFTLINEMGY